MITIGGVGLLMREAACSDKLTEADARKLLALGSAVLDDLPLAVRGLHVIPISVGPRLHEIIEEMPKKA